MAVCSMCGNEITAANGVCAECGELDFYFDMTVVWLFKGDKLEIKKVKMKVTKKKILVMPFGYNVGLIAGIVSGVKEAHMWKHLIFSKRISDIESIEWPLTKDYRSGLVSAKGDNGVLVKFNDGDKMILSHDRKNAEFFYRNLKMLLP